jgi:hypothetical protein
MHRRLRIALSYRRDCLAQDIETYRVALAHFNSCTECKETEFCPKGTAMYEQTQLAAARAKLLRNDDPYWEENENDKALRS